MTTKKIIILIAIIFMIPLKSVAVIKNGLFATVGNKTITHYDIVTEAKVILILNGQAYTDEKKSALQKSAINSLIKRNIKTIEIEKYSLGYKEEDINRELQRLVKRINIDVDQLKNMLASNGIEFSSIINQIRTELLWNTLIFEIYKDRLSVSASEIEEQLKNMSEIEIKEYLISELIIKPVSSDLVDKKIKEINEKIKIQGFEEVVSELSISETAIKKGDIGWLSENAISDKFKSVIEVTKIGDITQPIFLPDGILFFKVRDVRIKDKMNNLVEAKDDLVSDEKTKILNMHSLSHYERIKRSVVINYFND
jgi:peptidyl-prolyl cis-trans isomerase SurA